MYRHPSIPSSNIDASEDGLLDISTAPTTPDGSLSFSPVLQALKLQDALEDAASGRGKQRASSTSLGAAMRASGGGAKNICCVGAGYVGKFIHEFDIPFCDLASTLNCFPANHFNRWSYSSRNGLPKPPYQCHSRGPRSSPNQAVEDEAPSNLRTRPIRNPQNCARWLESMLLLQ